MFTIRPRKATTDLAQAEKPCTAQEILTEASNASRSIFGTEVFDRETGVLEGQATFEFKRHSSHVINCCPLSAATPPRIMYRSHSVHD